MVRLSAPVGGVVGVDVGHGHVRVAVADRSGTVLAEEHALVDVDAHGAEVLDRTAAMVRALAVEAGLRMDELQAAGMCVPAPVDRRSSRIRTGIMPGWQGLVPGEELERRLGVPVHADNDANLGALAELHHGIARGRHDVVYLKIASGVGAGIVLGGRLHRGASGIAGEIGHVQVGEDGQVCRCGNRGCLETMVSASRLLDLLRPAYDEPLSIEQVLVLDAEGDAGVRRVLNDAGRTIGRAVADLANSLNPELVVVGGTLGGSPSVVDGLRGALDRYAQPDTAAALEVVPGALGVRSAVVGAVALAIARVAAG